MRDRAKHITEDGASQSAYVHDFVMIYAVCVELSGLWICPPPSTACPPIYARSFIFLAFNRF